jgi:hypothetical protein
VALTNHVSCVFNMMRVCGVCVCHINDKHTPVKYCVHMARLYHRVNTHYMMDEDGRVIN